MKKPSRAKTNYICNMKYHHLPSNMRFSAPCVSEIHRKEEALKEWIFGGLHLRGKQMMCVFRERNSPEDSTECVRCTRGKEDCSHLFFVCPDAQRIWTMQNISGVHVTFDEAFSGSLRGGVFRREAQWGGIPTVLWSI